MTEIEHSEPDPRKREKRAGEYWIASVGSGVVSCYKPGLLIIDWYRTEGVLAKVGMDERKAQKHD